ncbi:hypothetical protein D3C74_329320 [compost metagenome]
MFQSLTYLTQNTVSCLLSERIINGLEPVDIQDQYTNKLFLDHGIIHHYFQSL